MKQRLAPTVIGYTRSGKPVIEPTRGAPNTNDIVVFKRTKAKFASWSKTDHMDASALLMDRGESLARSEAPADRKISRYCTNWSSVHWDIGGRWTSPEFDTIRRR